MNAQRQEETNEVSAVKSLGGSITTSVHRIAGLQRRDRRRQLAVMLDELGTRRMLHRNGVLLFDHLLGTFDILRRWSQPEATCIAGALHVIYGTESVPTLLVSPERRAEMRATVGWEAERIVHLFSTIRRCELVATLQLHQRIPEAATPTANWGKAGLRVEPHELAALVAIHMAKELEQSGAPGGGPVPVAGSVLHLGSYLRPECDVVPGMIGLGRAPKMGDEREACELYAAGLSIAVENPALAQSAFEQAALLSPLMSEPHLWHAYLSLAQGQNHAAQRRAALAKFLFERWGAPWDKRLTYHAWMLFARIVEALGTSGAVDPLLLPPPAADELPAFLSRVVGIYFDESSGAVESSAHRRRES